MLPHVGLGDGRQRLRAARKDYEKNVHKISRKLGMFFDGESATPQARPQPHPHPHFSTATSCSVMGSAGCLPPTPGLTSLTSFAMTAPPLAPLQIDANTDSHTNLRPRRSSSAMSPSRSHTVGSAGAAARQRLALRANTVAWQRVNERKRNAPPTPHLTPLGSDLPPRSPADLAILPVPDSGTLRLDDAPHTPGLRDVFPQRSCGSGCVSIAGLDRGHVAETYDLSNREIRPVDVFEAATYFHTVAHTVAVDLRDSTICKRAYDILLGTVAEHRWIVAAYTEGLRRKQYAAPGAAAFNAALTESLAGRGSPGFAEWSASFVGFDNPPSKARSPAARATAAQALTPAPDTDLGDVAWALESNAGEATTHGMVGGDHMPEHAKQQLEQRLTANRDALRRRAVKGEQQRRAVEEAQQRRDHYIATVKLEEDESAARTVHAADWLAMWRSLQEQRVTSYGKLAARLERTRKRKAHQDRMHALLELEAMQRVQLEVVIVRFQLMWWEKVELKLRGGLANDAQTATALLLADAAADKVAVKLRINERKARELQEQNDVQDEEAIQRAATRDSEDRRYVRLMDDERKVRTVTLMRYEQRVDLQRLEEGARVRVMCEEGEEWMWLGKKYEIAEERRIQELEKQRKIVMNKEKVIRERWANQESILRTTLTSLSTSCKGIIASIGTLKAHRGRRAQLLRQPPVLAVDEEGRDNFTERRYFLGQHLSTHEQEPETLRFARSACVDCAMAKDFERKVAHADTLHEEERNTTYSRWCGKLEQACDAVPYALEQLGQGAGEHTERLEAAITTVRGIIAGAAYDAARAPTDAEYVTQWKEYILGGRVELRCVDPTRGDHSGHCWAGESVASEDGQWLTPLDSLEESVVDAVQVTPRPDAPGDGCVLTLNIPRGATPEDIEECIQRCTYAIKMDVTMGHAPIRRAVDIAVTVYVPYLDEADLYLEETDMHTTPLSKRTWRLTSNVVVPMNLCQPLVWLPVDRDDAVIKSFVEGDHIDKAIIFSDVMFDTGEMENDFGSETEDEGLWEHPVMASTTPPVDPTTPPFRSCEIASPTLVPDLDGATNFDGFNMQLAFREGYTTDDMIVFKDGGTLRYNDADRTILLSDPVPMPVAIVLKGTVQRYQSNNVSVTEPNDAEFITIRIISPKVTLSVLKKIFQRIRYYNSSVDPVEGRRVLSLTLRKGFVRATITVIVVVHGVDNPTVFNVPYTKKFYHFPCTHNSVAPQLRQYVKEDNFRPFSDGTLEDVDTDFFGGGYVTVSIAYNAQKGDYITFDDAVFKREGHDRCSGLRLLPLYEDEETLRLYEAPLRRGQSMGEHHLMAGPRAGARARSRSARMSPGMQSLASPITSPGTAATDDLPEVPPLVIERAPPEEDSEVTSDPSSTLPVPQAAVPTEPAQPQRLLLWNVWYDGCVVGTMGFYDALSGDEGARGRRGQHHQVRRESMPVPGRRALAVHVNFSLSGSANLDAAQAFIQAVVFVPVQMNKPGEYIRTLSCEFQVGITVGKKDARGKDLDPGTCDASNFQPPLRQTVQVKVTPPLATPIANKGTSIAYREGAAAARLGAFDSPADHSATDTYLEGGFIAMEVVEGREVEHDVCGVREEGGITLKPTDSFITTAFYPWFLMIGERYEEGGKAKVVPPQPSLAPPMAPLSVAPVASEKNSPLTPTLPQFLRVESSQSMSSSPPEGLQASTEGQGGGSCFLQEPSMGNMRSRSVDSSSWRADLQNSGDTLRTHSQRGVMDRSRSVGGGLVRKQTSKRRLRKSLMASLKVQVHEVYLDGKHVGTLHTAGSTLKLVFAKNRQQQVTRKELLTLLKSLTYGNISKAPVELHKVLRVMVSDGTPVLTQMIYEVEIIPVDDVTEIVLRQEKVRFRPCPDDAIVPFPIVPLGEGNVDDPDTDYFDGGYLEVSIVHGYNRGDTLSFLTLEQQNTQLHRRDNPVLPFTLGCNLPRTATHHGLLAGTARRKRGDAFANKTQVEGQAQSSFSTRGSFAGSTLHVTSSELARHGLDDATTKLTPIDNAADYIFDYREADKQLVNTGGMYTAMVASIGKKLRVDFPAPADVEDCAVTWEVVSYILNCITFQCDGAKGKFLQGPRTLMIKVRDAANPSPGKEKLVVEVRHPVFLLTSVHPYPVDVLQHPIAPGKAVMIMPKVQVNCSDGIITTGYLHIEIVDGFTEGDALAVNWKDGFVIKENTVLAKGSNTFLAPMTYNCPRCVGLEFTSKSKFSGIHLTAVLKAAAYKFAPQTELVKKTVLIAVATDCVSRPAVERVHFVPPEAK